MRFYRVKLDAVFRISFTNSKRQEEEDWMESALIPKAIRD
jgi:hypothetical protein